VGELGAALEHACALAAHGGDVLVQELLTAAVRTGVVSVVCLGGRVSHSMRRQAAPGEFRVGEGLGGSRAKISADEGSAVAAASTRALRALEVATGAEPVYARFDFVEGRCDGLWHPVLLSADVVEADLFLDDHAPAVRPSARRSRLSLHPLHGARA
jgi:hypothetical protein